MHPAVEEIEELVAIANLDGAKQGLLTLLNAQIDGAQSPSVARQFKSFRTEAFLHAAELSNLKVEQRRALRGPEELAMERRRLTHALLGLLEEIDGALSRSAAPKPAALPTMDADLSAAIPEKVYGRKNLQSISWLSKGIEVGKSVCRIITPEAFGTGFLTTGGRVITNNHVVPTAEIAAKTRVEFNYQRDAEGTMHPSSIYKASGEDFFTAPDPVDCSVLTLVEPVDNLTQWGSLKLCNDVLVSVGDPVTIIQHPNGGEKQIAVTANEIVAILGGKLAYLTNTLSGSSGSPVFNERWEVIALHRAGGALVRSDEGGSLRANEGVLFSEILTTPGLRSALAAAG